MSAYPLIKEALLAPYGARKSVLSKIYALYEQQLENFPLLASGHAGLSAVERRTVEVHGDTLTVQLNPARMKSVGARLDNASIQARPCFLCPENLPPGQRALPLAMGWFLLCNPVPIFERHFTIASAAHTRQDLNSRADQFLRLGAALGPDLLVFFNGAQAGASAPDHMHFQAVPSESFPLVRKIKAMFTKLPRAGGLQLGKIDFAGVTFLCMSGRDRPALSRLLDKAVNGWAGLMPDGGELIDLLVTHANGFFMIVFMPRLKLRPSCYFSAGEEQILISPATVEMSGVMITPRSEDYQKINARHIAQAFKEVSATAEQVDELLKVMGRI